MKLEFYDNPVHREVLDALRKNRIQAQRYLDVGCRDGVFTLKVAELVGAKEVYGIDVGELSPSGGLKFIRLDAFKDKFPFPDGYLDLVTAIELIEHLPYGDNLLAESFRVLKDGGYLLITTPNLASWVNRLLLLFGYQTTISGPQPSRYYVVGLPGGIRKRTCFGDPWDLGHVCGYTFKGLKDLLAIYGFDIVYRKGIPMKYSFRLANWLEKIFSRKASLAGGILILAKKGKRFRLTQL